MIVKFKLSESLLSIYKDLDNNFEENIEVNIQNPTSIGNLIISLGINPILTPMILIDNKKVGFDYVVEKDETATLIGPLAGG